MGICNGSWLIPGIDFWLLLTPHIPRGATGTAAGRGKEWMAPPFPLALSPQIKWHSVSMELCSVFYLDMVGQCIQEHLGRRDWEGPSAESEPPSFQLSWSTSSPETPTELLLWATPQPKPRRNSQGKNPTVNGVKSTVTIRKGKENIRALLSQVMEEQTIP